MSVATQGPRGPYSTIQQLLTRLEEDALSATRVSLEADTAGMLERALADAVSANEELDDFSVFALRCLNVPYYLALWHDGEGGRSVDRKRRALAYYDGFLDLCLRHKVLEPKVRGLVEACVERVEEVIETTSMASGAVAKSVEESMAESVAGTSSSKSISREQKIEMFKTERQLAKSVAALRATGGGDEDRHTEDLRPLYLMMISQFAIKACGARELVQQEVRMLSAVAAMSEDERMKATARREQSEENKHVMDKLREAVRGLSGLGSAGGRDGKKEALRAGVFKPSHVLPTMTVEQFGDMEVARMQEDARRKAEAEAEEQRRQVLSLNGKAEREAVEEEALRKARAWDDFRDDNKKGSGNSKLRNTV